MKIAFVNACRYLGGAELWHLAAAKEFLARGHRVWLLARPGPLAERAQSEKIPTLIVPMRNDVDLFSFIRFCNFFIEERIEVVIANDSRDLRLAGTAAWLTGVPVRIHRKGALHLDPGPLNRFLYGPVLTHVIAISSAVAEGLFRFGFPADRLLLFRNGVDLDRFPGREGSRVREAWSVPTRITLIGVSAG